MTDLAPTRTLDGMEMNIPLPGGGVVVGNEVRLTLDVEPTSRRTTPRSPRPRRAPTAAQRLKIGSSAIELTVGSAACPSSGLTPSICWMPFNVE